MRTQSSCTSVRRLERFYGRDYSRKLHEFSSLRPPCLVFVKDSKVLFYLEFFSHLGRVSHITVKTLFAQNLKLFFC